MSDKNKDGVAAAGQTQPSHYELSRAFAKQGVHNSAAKAIELGQNPPTSKGEAAIFAAKAGSAGAKEYGKSAYHAGMGFIEGVNKQNPNSGQQLNNMRINQAIANANQPTVNKGIEAARQKATEKQTGTNPGQSTNKGIASFQSKASGQSSGASSGQSNSGQSSGSGKGQSR